MRTAILLPLLALCSACAVVPPQAWTFDPTHPQQAPLAPQELAALTGKVTQLRSERDQIRDRIAVERDAGQRQQHYAQLHRVGMSLSPLERRLAASTPPR